MRKQLLATTTIVAVGLLAAGGVGTANAAEPMSVSVGGFFSAVGIFWDQGDQDSLRGYGVERAGELQLTASTTLDNGLKVSARIEYEATNQGGGGSIVDENYVTFDGGFGRLRIGSDDNAGYALHVQAPVAAWRVGINSPTFAVLSPSGNAASSFVSTYPGIGGDGDKVIYFTPRVQGFQFGISFQPDGGTLDSQSAAGTSDATVGQQSDVVSVGLNYSGSFDDVSVDASVAFVQGTLEATGGTPTDDREQLAFGLTIGFGGFAIGGAYLVDDKGTVNDTTTLDIGATYSSGPWTVGVNYGSQEVELTGAGDDTVDAVGVTAKFDLGPGVSLIGAIKHYDYDSDTSTSKPSGLVATFGTEVSF